MARKPDPAVETDLTADIAPEDPTPPGSDVPEFVPRLSANDGQPGAAAATATLPDEPNDLVETEVTAGELAEGEQPPATPATASAPFVVPAGLTQDQVNRYIQRGLAEEMGLPRQTPNIPAPVLDLPEIDRTAASAITNQPIGRAPAPVVDEEADPDLDKLADRLAKRMGLPTLVENVNHVITSGRTREANQISDARETRVNGFVNQYVDDFCKTNQLAAADEDVADAVRQTITARVTQRLQAERAARAQGRPLPEINWAAAIAEDAINIAVTEANRFARRAQRQASARTEVAGKTRAAVGGVPPTPGAPVKPATGKQRGDDMERKLKARGWE